MTSDNPLLAPHEAPIHFDALRPEHVEPGIEARIAEARAALEGIKAAERPGTWAATFGALDTATEGLERAYNIVSHLKSVAHTAELADAHQAVTPGVTAFFAGIALDDDLFEALQAYADSEEGRALTGARRRFVDKTLADFRRHGAGLDAEHKAELEALTTRLAHLANTFSRNVLESTGAWEHVVTDEADLSGLPEGARAMAKAAAEQAGVEGWRFTLATPLVIATLTHADDASLRERIWRAWNRRAATEPHANPPVITEMIALRRRRAELLGYDDFSDLILDDRMAHDGDTAEAFVDRLEARARPAFERETAELLTFRQTLDGHDTLQPWDVGYVADKQQKALFDLDQEALRPYFPLESVMTGLFSLVQRLYGLSVDPAELPTWHDDVRTYQLTEADGTVVGAFYADLFPRSDKRDGAWMNALRTGEPHGDDPTPHLGLICANVSPPVGDKPALLTHREVETLFHEFGHLLHHLLSRTELKSQAGTRVAWDFVELPSQIMENWCWEREALDLFARHHETGESLPDDLFANMVAARTHRKASWLMRQLGFARADLALHRHYDPDADGDLVRYARDVMARYAVVEPPEDYAMVASFGHLFSSPVAYAAGYYSYLWAAVLDADAFTRFAQQGLFDRATGQAFRDTILARGDSADPADLYRAFMGRDPDPEALLRRAGLAA